MIAYAQSNGANWVGWDTNTNNPGVNWQVFYVINNTVSQFLFSNDFTQGDSIDTIVANSEPLILAAVATASGVPASSIDLTMFVPGLGKPVKP
jgi:hypothetical protein